MSPGTRRPLTRSTARHPLRGGGLGYAAAAWRRAGLWGVGLLLRSVPQFPAIFGRCPVESGAVAFHALTGIKTGK
ncbi:hypothetical protein FYA19_22930 (plasmid) [Escherichia coli O16:H48]|nr:hypothetical protein FYA19_22930 [Escherichia coli O16:H48]